MGYDLGIKGVEGGFEVQSEFVKGLFRVGDSSISHSVIPGFCVGGSSSIAHFVKGSHDLCTIRRVQGQV